MFIEFNDRRLVKIDDIIAIFFGVFPNNFCVFTKNRSYKIYPRLDPIASDIELMEQRQEDIESIVGEIKRHSDKFMREGGYLFNKEYIESASLEGDTIMVVTNDGQEFTIVYPSEFFAKKGYEALRTKI